MSSNISNELTIISLRELTRADVIDGGDTLALRICCADGQPAALLVPREVARGMVELLSEKVAEASARATGRPEQ